MQSVVYGWRQSLSGPNAMSPLRSCVAISLLNATLMAPALPVDAASGTARADRPTSEALYTKCRKAVFAKYGKRMLHDGRMKLGLENQFASDMTDMCVRNGGRVS